MNAPRFREQDIPIAITTLIQVLVLQLIDAEVLTVEQAEQVFDGAASGVLASRTLRLTRNASSNTCTTNLTGTSTINWRLTAGDIGKRGTDLKRNRPQFVSWSREGLRSAAHEFG